FVPNAKVRFRDVWIGAVVTGLLWKGALEGFSWYMGDLSRFSRVNGSIAAVIAFMIWVYVQAVILLYGVEFTAAYARLLRGRPEGVPAAAASRAGVGCFAVGCWGLRGRVLGASRQWGCPDIVDRLTLLVFFLRSYMSE